MRKMFDAWIHPVIDKLENLLKIGSITRAKGEDGKAQEIQIKTARGIEDALKMGNFGFNSKAPEGSRAVVSKVGNKKIVIANEHFASIIDVASGDSVVYNASGTYMKLVGDNIEVNCTKFVIDADLEVTKGITAVNDIVSDGEVTAQNAVPAAKVSLSTHLHLDSTGNPTQSPTPGT